MQITEQFERDGYLFPYRAFSAAQAAGYRDRLEFAEQVASGRPELKAKMARGYSHMMMPWVAEVARTPAIVNVVSALLGPNVLLWMSSIFAKDPKSHAYVGWHQDLHYWGLSGTQEVTAWVALTPATAVDAATWSVV